MSSSRYSKYEISVGAFVLTGVAALLYLSVSLGGLKLFSDDTYNVSARFASVGGLKVGDPVRVAGVPVGEVESITLDNFQALTALRIQVGVTLPADTIASVQSAGLLGDNYVSLTPGADDKNLQAGGRIARTESAVSLTELLAKYAFGSPVSDDDPEKPAEKKSEGSGDSDSPDPATDFDDPLK